MSNSLGEFPQDAIQKGPKRLSRGNRDFVKSLFLKDAKDQNLLIGLDVLQRSDGSTDHNTLHGGCKVLAGEKWLATKWMRQDVFND